MLIAAVAFDGVAPVPGALIHQGVLFRAYFFWHVDLVHLGGLVLHL